ncbi:MAG TPA: NAD-dependent epimerase/dehydratase family protein [Terriglobales bacterium]|nr:NAD-dependent epimerase/dehydratase family protein [Terriglobales bacterium]
MRVLIIGGTAFMGPCVVRALVSAGQEVTIFHRGEHEPELPSSVRHVHSPSAAFPVLNFPAELISREPDVVLHMVAMGQRDTEAVVRAFKGVARRLVVPSSGDVYGAYGVLIGSESDAPHEGLLCEDSRLRKSLYPYRKTAKGPDDWIYHYDKILVERVVMSDPELAGTILRLPAVYGPGDSRHGFSAHLKRMDDRRPAILLDENHARWRWSHGYVENVSAAISLAVMDDRASGRIYNVGEESVPTTAERVRHLANLVRWEGEVVTVPRASLPPHLQDGYNYSVDLAYDTSRIRRELGYKEMVSVDEGLRRTIAWVREHHPSTDAARHDYAAEDAALITAKTA